MQVVRDALASDVPVLLDADAITIVAEHPEWLQDRAAPTLLTPHDREFARIAGSEPGPDRIAAARTAAGKLDATVLLKGDRTIVAAPPSAHGGESVHVNPTGTPVLATAGTGDVLSGLAGALLAAGLPPHEAGAYAAFVHGLAGRYAAETGPVSASTLAGASSGRRADGAGRLNPAEYQHRRRAPPGPSPGDPISTGPHPEPATTGAVPETMEPCCKRRHLSIWTRSAPTRRCWRPARRRA